MLLAAVLESSEVTWFLSPLSILIDEGFVVVVIVVVCVVVVVVTAEAGSSAVRVVRELLRQGRDC